MPGYVPKNLQELIEECWHKNPARRPPILEIAHRLEVIIADNARSAVRHSHRMGELPSRIWSCTNFFAAFTEESIGSASVRIS